MKTPKKARARVASLMIGVTASQRHMVDAVRQALAPGR